MSFMGLGVAVPTRDNITPSYHTFTFSVQRQLPGANLLEVNYTSTKGTHQYVPITNLNMLDPIYWGMGRTELNALVPNPFYGVITDPRSSLSAPDDATLAVVHSVSAIHQRQPDQRSRGGRHAVPFGAIQVRAALLAGSGDAGTLHHLQGDRQRWRRFGKSGPGWAAARPRSRTYLT